MTLPAGIRIDWPFNKVALRVKKRLFCCATELVLLAHEKVYADYSKNCEDKGLKDADVEKTWYCRKYC